MFHIQQNFKKYFLFSSMLQNTECDTSITLYDRFFNNKENNVFFSKI